MTIRWDNLVNISVENKNDEKFPIRVYNFSISMSPFYDSHHSTEGREDRTGNCFWYQEGRNCFWNIKLLASDDSERFERSFEIFNQGHLHLPENVKKFLSLLEIDLDKKSKQYAFKRPAEISIESFILPKIVNCLPDDVIINEHYFGKIVDIVGRGRIEAGSYNLYPRKSYSEE